MARETKKRQRKLPTSPTATYSWEGKNKLGKYVRGDMVATNIAMVKASLRSQGIIPLKVRRKSNSLFSKRQKKKVRAADICAFTRQMATMMQSGVPLMQSFDIIARGHDNFGMRELVGHLRADVESGLSFSDALKRHPKYFDDLYCALVEAGEQSGSLETMLDRVALYKEKTEAIKRKIKKAMFYPTAVMIVAIIVTMILLIFVVPQFAELFEGFNAELPAFTMMVLSISDAVQSHGILMAFIAGIAGWGFFKAYQRYPQLRDFCDRVQLKLPVLGKILNQAVIARYARTLSTTFSAGVPLIEALDSVAGATGNVVYRQAVMNIKEKVSTGSPMQNAMDETKLFPNMVVQMVAIGEESGTLDGMLTKVANIYEEEVDMAVDGLSSLLEPLIMVVLGVLIGGLVIAMYLPIFKLGSVV